MRTASRVDYTRVMAAQTNEIAFVDWPNGMRAINIHTKQERQLTHFNAWHAISNHVGSRIIADTNFPDIGLQIFDPDDQIST